MWLDIHYERNWSVWLDLVILARTIRVAIEGISAYQVPYSANQFVWSYKFYFNDE